MNSKTKLAVIAIIITLLIALILALEEGVLL